MFLRKKAEINPFSVSDKVRFRNIDKTLDLSVRGSGSSMILALKMAQERLSSVTDDSTEEERLAAARGFARAIFGEEQAGKLIDFYDNDPVAVITACGTYFSERLGKLITKAQTK